MPAAHIGKGAGGRAPAGVGYQCWPLPLRSEELAERIPWRKADADPVGTQLLDRRGAKILRLADTHGSRKA